MMRKWILKNGISDEESLIKLENKAKTFVKIKKIKHGMIFKYKSRKKESRFYRL